MDCRVLFDYKGTEEDELDLKKGEIVLEVTSGGGLEEGWWSGKVNGKKGVFPNNFVEPIVNAYPTVPAPSNGSGHNAPKYTPLSGQSDPVLRSGVNRMQRAKVTFSYKPVNTDELRLDIGDVVEIFSQVEDGWFSGANMGSKGVFPSNFVELMEDSVPPTPDTSQPPNPAKDAKSKPPVGGVALPFLPMPLTVRPSENDPVKSKRPTAASGPERARVTYGYEPQEEDELKLEVGDVVEVLNKEHAEGWWEGRYNGKTGVFPNNFVELLSLDASKPGTHKPIAKPIQAPRTELDQEVSLPRKPSLKGAPVPTLVPKKSGPTNELQRKLDRRNLLNTGPDSTVAPTDNGAPPAPQQAPRTLIEESSPQEEQKHPIVRRSSHELPRQSAAKPAESSAEIEQLRQEVSEAKKEIVRLKQEYREDFDRLLEEREADRKLLSDLKIEVDSLKKRRADYWNPEKFF